MPGWQVQVVSRTVSQNTFSNQNATPFAGEAGTCIVKLKLTNADIAQNEACL
jgi:hypothetical protein